MRSRGITWRGKMRFKLFWDKDKFFLWFMKDFTGESVYTVYIS